jgi:hypothetical protein
MCRHMLESTRTEHQCMLASVMSACRQMVNSRRPSIHQGQPATHARTVHARDARVAQLGHDERLLVQHVLHGRPRSFQVEHLDRDLVALWCTHARVLVKSGVVGQEQVRGGPGQPTRPGQVKRMSGQQLGGQVLATRRRQDSGKGHHRTPNLLRRQSPTPNSRDCSAPPCSAGPHHRLSATRDALMHQSVSIKSVPLLP